MGGKKKTKTDKKNPPELCIFVTYCFSLIIDVIMRRKKKSYFYTPNKPVSCISFSFSCLSGREQRCGILGQDTPCVASGAPVSSAFSGGEKMRHPRSP